MILVIAFDFCPFDASDAAGYSNSSPTNYKESCKEVATSICEGAIYGYVKQNGCSLSTGKLTQLQAKCEGQVESMVGGEEVAVAMTRRLRKKNEEIMY